MKYWSEFYNKKDYVHTNDKSYNLMADFVPKDRTCSDADIPEEWCNCLIKNN